MESLALGHEFARLLQFLPKYPTITFGRKNEATPYQSGQQPAARLSISADTRHRMKQLQWVRK
jgi:hypothetical protein